MDPDDFSALAKDLAAALDALVKAVAPLHDRLDPCTTFSEREALRHASEQGRMWVDYAQSANP